MTAKYTATEILLTPMTDNDAGAKTIGQYLARLSQQVISEVEGFSGKRPFGNSGWQLDIVHALVLNKFIDGELDEDGYVTDYSYTEFTAAMKTVYDLLFNADYSTLALPPVPKDHYIVLLTADRDIERQMVDFDDTPYTKEAAEKRVNHLNDAETNPIWVPIHIPL